MWVSELAIRDLRCLAEARLEGVGRVNLLLGPNGSGKTSVLESIHLLGFGRSFRGGSRDGLIRYGAESTRVVARIGADRNGPSRILGFERDRQSWRARCDGVDVGSLSELVALCPVLCVEPDAHELIAGPSDLRRSVLDWLLFHVEPAGFEVWRRHRAVLEQRNALLRRRGGARELDSWDEQLVPLGLSLSVHRQRFVELLREEANLIVARMASTLGSLSIEFRSGWGMQELREADMLERLRQNRPTDLDRGFTGIGSQRADWKLLSSGAGGRENVSRGQQKLLALAVVLAQGRLAARLTGRSSVLLVDDLASELDRGHRVAAWREICSTGFQVWFAGTDVIADDVGESTTVFHVEQGKVSPGS